MFAKHWAGGCTELCLHSSLWAGNEVIALLLFTAISQISHYSVQFNYFLQAVHCISKIIGQQLPLLSLTLTQIHCGGDWIAGCGQIGLAASVCGLRAVLGDRRWGRAIRDNGTWWRWWLKGKSRDGAQHVTFVISQPRLIRLLSPYTVGCHLSHVQ